MIHERIVISFSAFIICGGKKDKGHLLVKMVTFLGKEN